MLQDNLQDLFTEFLKGQAVGKTNELEQQEKKKLQEEVVFFQSIARNYEKELEDLKKESNSIISRLEGELMVEYYQLMTKEERFYSDKIHIFQQQLNSGDLSNTLIVDICKKKIAELSKEKDEALLKLQMEYNIKRNHIDSDELFNKKLVESMQKEKLIEKTYQKIADLEMNKKPSEDFKPVGDLIQENEKLKVDLLEMESELKNMSDLKIRLQEVEEKLRLSEREVEMKERYQEEEKANAKLLLSERELELKLMYQEKVEELKLKLQESEANFKVRMSEKESQLKMTHFEKEVELQYKLQAVEEKLKHSEKQSENEANLRQSEVESQSVLKLKLSEMESQLNKKELEMENQLKKKELEMETQLKMKELEMENQLKMKEFVENQFNMKLLEMENQLKMKVSEMEKMKEIEMEKRVSEMENQLKMKEFEINTLKESHERELLNMTLGREKPSQPTFTYTRNDAMRDYNISAFTGDAMSILLKPCQRETLKPFAFDPEGNNITNFSDYIKHSIVVGKENDDEKDVARPKKIVKNNRGTKSKVIKNESDDESNQSSSSLNNSSTLNSVPTRKKSSKATTSKRTPNIASKEKSPSTQQGGTPGSNPSSSQ